MLSPKKWANQVQEYKEEKEYKNIIYICNLKETDLEKSKRIKLEIQEKIKSGKL